MDSSPSRSNTKSSACRSRPRSRQGGVRVVGKIRPFLDSEIVGSSDADSCSSIRPQISFLRPDEDSSSIVFGDQAASRKDSYKLDWCYGQDEGAGEIFSREIKPLLQGIFHGCNACVIAYGTKGSGKTQLIQGSEENPGLATMAVSEILQSAEEVGSSVSISCYEVYQDRVYDLLEPKGQEVLVLEDAGRKIQLKGLSLVPVKSILDFQKVYFHGCNQRKSSQKIVNDVAIRSHRGLIAYVSESNNTIIGKMNFVDLAGYEDIKKNSNDRLQLAESVKVNKSLYALLNVVYALNSDETFIPYRENKLTRLLQDFLCRGSEAVLITCLDPTLCQDTVHAVSLASRSCQAVNQHRQDSAKGSKSAPRFAPPCSPINGGTRTMNTPINKHEKSQLGSIERKECRTPSIIKKRPQLPGNSVKKHVVLTEKKAKDTPSMRKGGKLLNVTSPITNYMQDIISSNAATIMNTSKEESALLIPTVAELSITDEETCASHLANNCESYMPEVDVSPANEHNDFQGTVVGLEIDQETSFEPHDNITMQKENQNSHIGAIESSPPLSERLREISNSLKLLSSQPLSINTPQGDVSCTRQASMDAMDPKTPEVGHLRLDYNSRFENTATPHDMLKARSTGLKKSLVQECLAFLNSANKEELKNLKGIGEKRAAYILQLRENDPEPFKQIDNLKGLGLSSNQIKEMMTRTLGDF